MVGIILPGAIGTALVVRALLRGIWRAEVIALLANIAALDVFLPDSAWQAYTTAGRVGIGVVLAAIYCIPYLPRLGLTNRLWPVAAAAAWR